MKTVLTIAGSDPSGGAGLQADLRTFHALGVRGVTAVTAVTAQNEKRFFSLNPVSSRLVREQLQSITSVTTIDAVKIGLLGTEDNASAVYRFVEQAHIPFVILDPVLRSSTGAILLDTKGVAIMKDFLTPFVSLITANLSEAEILTGRKVNNIESMKEASRLLYQAHRGLGAVLIKGGHLKETATDVLYDGKVWHLFDAVKLPVASHGTGCVLSSAIASYLVLGENLPGAVKKAKDFVSRRLEETIKQQGPEKPA